MTRLGDAALVALEKHPEYTESVKAVIVLRSGNVGGIAYSGYEDMQEAASDMLLVIRATGIPGVVFIESGRN
jgi:hypothetical protein